MLQLRRRDDIAKVCNQVWIRGMIESGLWPHDIMESFMITVVTGQLILVIIVFPRRWLSAQVSHDSHAGPLRKLRIATGRLVCVLAVTHNLLHHWPADFANIDRFLLGNHFWNWRLNELLMRVCVQSLFHSNLRVLVASHVRQSFWLLNWHRNYMKTVDVLGFGLRRWKFAWRGENVIWYIELEVWC